MKSVLKRGYVTDFLLKTLEDADFLVGDAVAPDEGGWDGDPGREGSNFHPYLVLTPQLAPAATGSLGDSSSEWNLPYALSANGVDRRQVEDLADDARELLAGLHKVYITIGGDRWRLNQVQATAVGALTYSTAVDPTQFSQTDSMLTMLSKSP